MPNKDSFTFSDKLRKSKSVPLSKRLPSIVGGQNKQKRTLVQRAQRDLPFILVAALALLLLPFLSRTGSDDIASTGDLAWNSLADAPSFAEGGGADVMPAGSLKDPLDWIVRPRSQVEGSGVTMGTDASKSAYGSSSEDGYGDGSGSSRSSGYRSRSYSTTGGSSSTRPDYNTRKSYDEQYTTKTTKVPATTKYGAKTRASVRKSFERKGTDINRALRISQMPGQKGGSGISHSLPIGQGPTRGSGTAFREGIRPIALQPMEARGGVGRSMTGENLYAEAARSRNAMNAGGPAKANLLAAQMRDVDGALTPEGFGGPGPGASVRPGGHGGGPGNNNGYNVSKPWWWDMMQARSQKMWDLWYYKPREMFWTNMYKIGLGLFNCLFTGNKDGDISNFFGKSAGDSDWACVDSAGNNLMKTYNKQKTKKTKDKDGNVTEELEDSNWEYTCVKLLNGKIIEKKKSDKNLFQVRAECLGLDVLFDWMKGWVKKEYTTNCDTVTVDGIKGYTVEAKRKGLFQKDLDTNDRLNKKAVIALIAEPQYEGTTYDIYPLPTSDNIPEIKMVSNPGYYDSNEYVVKVEHTQQLSMSRADIDKWNDAHPCCKLTKVVSFISRRIANNVEYETNKLSTAKDYALIDFSDRAPFSESYCACNKKDKGRALTFKELKNDLHPKKNSVNQCPIPSPEKFAKEMKLNGDDCYNYPDVSIDIDNRATAKAFIENPAGKYVFAVAVEQLTSMTEPVIRHIESYGLISRENAKQGLKTVKYEYDEGKKAYHFYFETNLAVEGFNTPYTSATTLAGSNAARVNQSTVRGEGRIFWIVTSQSSLDEGITTGTPAKFKGKSLNQLRPTDFAKDSGTTAICHYRWCDGVDTCSLSPSPKDHCFEGDNVYVASKVELDGKKVYVKIDDTPVNVPKTSDMEECVVLCYDEDGNVHICNEDGEPNPAEPPCPLDKMNPSREELGIPPCPDCCYYETSDGETNNYKSVEIKGKHYIIDATPNACDNPKGQCTPAAWSKEGQDLIVYDMSTYDPDCLKLVPGESTEAFKTCTGTGGKGCPKVNLTELDDSTPFTLIHQQSYRMDPNTVPGNPQYFELFPQLKAPNRQDIIDACTFKLTFNYQNASISPQNPDYQEAANIIMDCINKIKVLKASNPDLADDYSNLYFHGFASYGGTDYENCDGKTQSGDQCNLALSEDRNLFVMDKIAEILENQKGQSIGKEGGDVDYNGFTNTNYNGTPAKFPYRYGLNYAEANGSDITFKSIPYGSAGSTPTNKSMSKQEIEDIHAVDRFILININPTATREEASSGYTKCSASGVCYPSPSRTPYKK